MEVTLTGHDGPRCVNISGQEEASDLILAHGQLGSGTVHGRERTAMKASSIHCRPSRTFNPDNLLTWITHLTVAADQATPTNRLAALPKGNLY